jgi:predicted dehydrogenase
VAVRIAVAGAGLIGVRHIEEVDGSAKTELAAVVDPGPAGPVLAEKYGVARYRSLAELFARGRPDGVILATPNRLHVEGGLECVAAGVPVLVEKPVGDTVAGATRLVGAGERAGVPGAARSAPSSPSSVPPCSPSPTSTSTSAAGGAASPAADRSCSTSSTM